MATIKSGTKPTGQVKSIGSQAKPKTAGEIIEDLQARWCKSFIDADIEAYNLCETQYDALKEVVANLRKAVCDAWDQTHKGYSDTTWLKGKERLVKKDSDNPRGRKPKEKVRPSSVI